MRYAVACIGFIGFAAVSLLHAVSFQRIATFYGPDFRWIAAVIAGLAWIALLGLVARGMYHNRLRLPMGLVFAHGMIIVLGGMFVLDGVPSTIGEGAWRDPQHLLTPQTKYLLHNHSVVKKALSKQEYDLYSAYVCAYFTGAGMVFCAAASLGPLDRTGQLFPQRRPAVWALLNQTQLPQTPAPFRCPACRGAVSVAIVDRPRPWCPHCGVDLFG
ncbi:MAG TPA: hypothetical protein VGZ47_08605 [Gemmataceae bacterium]|jgi:hypothetical protein|nr:hypothetical protein [Gemmataceae bacterium]